jgi:PEP-CTERM motif
MNRIRQAPRRMHFPDAAAIAILLCMPGVATAAPPSPFTFATIGVYVKPGGEKVEEWVPRSTSGGVSGEVGAAPAAYGKVRADFGSVGFAMEAAQLDREVAGGGLWSDGFVVAGGTGSASVALSTRLTGRVVGVAELNYALFASPAPFDLQVVIDEIEAGDFGEEPQLSNATRLLFAHDETVSGAVDLSLFGSLTFTYGQPFYLLAGFAGEVNPGNSMNFYNSADFGITVPASAVLQPLSGSAYAAAVPEPATWLLFAAGLGAAAAFARRRPASGAAR